MIPKSIAATACLPVVLLAGRVLAEEFPQAVISNGEIQAVIYLPDPARGYYQGTRFDWSGQIASLKYKGHEFFGRWFERYDPKTHDAILGPVEEFQTRGAGLGYDDVKPGGSFVRIGVGAVRKPEEEKYRQFHTYEITDPGTRKVDWTEDTVEFVHEIPETAGYAYRYSKVLRLTPGKPQLVLEHRPENKGRQQIETTVYEHNFYVLDNQPTGPESSVTVPFDLKASRDLQDKARASGKQFQFRRELNKGESVFTELEGYAETSQDYDIRVENRAAGIGVRQTSDQPMSKLVLWSIRSTVCPEAYISLSIPSGESRSWKIVYDFYELDPESRR